MKLREWDWDRQAFVETDYPDGPIVEFVNWLRTTKAWHADPELVHRKLLHLNRGFAEHRQSVVEAAVETAKNMTASAKERRAAVNRENLKKARAAQARKRELARVAQTLSPDGELPRDL